jgi:hypothetical protein
VRGNHPRQKSNPNARWAAAYPRVSAVGCNPMLARPLLKNMCLLSGLVEGESKVSRTCSLVADVNQLNKLALNNATSQAVRAHLLSKAHGLALCHALFFLIFTLQEGIVCRAFCQYPNMLRHVNFAS